MTAVFIIVALLVLVALPSTLYLSVSRRKNPVMLSILTGVPLMLALCAATFVYFEGGETASMISGTVWVIIRIPLALVAATAVLYLFVSKGRSPAVQDPRKPPLRAGRIAGAILAGTALGFVALLAVYAAGIVLVDEGCYAGFEFMAIFVLAFPPLNGLGSAVGVYLVANRGNQTGSFLLTLVGGFLGGLLAGVASFFWLIGVEIVLSAPALLIAPVAATLAFNLTRRYKERVSPRSSGRKYFESYR